MFPVTCREVLAILLAGAVAVVVGLPIAGAAEEKPLSPETILETKFAGKATVELQVGEVHTLNIDALFVPDVSHDQIIKAKIPGAKTDQEFLVIVKREVATRLLKLGIADPAEHFRGKMLRVSGTVEQINRPSTPSTMVYRIQVTNLDQLETIRKPVLAGDKPTINDILTTKVTFEWDNGSLESCLLALATRVKADHPDFRIKVIGDDLKFEGITKNQRIRGLNLKDKTLAEVLTDIVLRANPNPLVKDPSDPELKLVWDVATAPDEPGVQAVLITTRNGAKKRNEKLPELFEKK